jgi:hypothetical protein
MRNMLSIRARLVSAALALPTAAVVVFAGSPPPAHAVEPGTILTAAKAAYEAYRMFAQTQELTLDQATTRIIDVVNDAKTEIISHVETIGAADVRACTRSAVSGLENIRRLSPDNQQAFALRTTDCVTLAEAYVATFQDRGAVDQIGFAVNIAGPIALFAHSHANLSTGSLKGTLIAANNGVVSKLRPSCSSQTESPGDDGVKPRPDQVEHLLVCTAYNGDQGFDHAVGRIPPGGFDYSHAREQALRRTSHPVAITSLSVLNA